MSFTEDQVLVKQVTRVSEEILKENSRMPLPEDSTTFI